MSDKTVEYIQPFFQNYPYFRKIKILKCCILEKIIGKVCIEKYNLLYNIISCFTNNKVNLNKEMKKQINKQINNSTEQNFEILDNMSEQDKINLEIEMNKRLNDPLELNEDEKTNCKNLYDVYKKEYKRVSKIKDNYIENYINADKLKSLHLESNNGKKETTKSNCNLKNFFNSINKKPTFEIIKEKYKKILYENGNPPIKMNDGLIERYYIITQIYDLFDKYLLTIKYCLTLIDKFPLVIRNPNIFLFDIKTKYSYFFEKVEENKIYINNMNTILNISLEKTNDDNNTINEKTIFVKFYKPEEANRNNVVFETGTFHATQ